MPIGETVLHRNRAATVDALPVDDHVGSNVILRAGLIHVAGFEALPLDLKFLKFDRGLTGGGGLDLGRGHPSDENGKNRREETCLSLHGGGLCDRDQ
jgi:hypothetical protein